MATAQRDSQSFNALYTSTIEDYLSGIEETVFEANQLIQILSRVSKAVGVYGFNIVQPLMTTKNTGVGWYEYDDSLSIDAMPGPEAAKFDMASLAGPLVITEQEEIENMEPHRRVHLLQFKADQLMLSMAEEVNRAAFEGSGTNSKQIDGLEDIIHGGSNTTLGHAASRSDATADVDNTYGGITRTGSTGWENYSWDLDDNATKMTSFTGDYYKTLELAYQYASRGAIRPDMILSSLEPYMDVHNLMSANATYRREVDSFRGVQLGHDNLKFRSAVWLYDEAATAFDAAGSASVDAGDHMVYIFNTNFLKLCVEEGYDFAITEFQTPVDGRVSIGHVLWRGQFLSSNPRFSSVLVDY